MPCQGPLKPSYPVENSGPLSDVKMKIVLSRIPKLVHRIEQLTDVRVDLGENVGEITVVGLALELRVTGSLACVAAYRVCRRRTVSSPSSAGP